MQVIPTIAVWGWVEDAFRWILDFVLAIFQFLIDLMFDLLPTAWKEGIESAWDTILPYMKVANTYVPLQEVAVMFTLYVSFKIAFICVKMVLKLIPFIG